MKTVRTLLGLFLVAAVCAGVSDVFAAAPPIKGAKGGKKHHHKTIKGKVVEVDHKKGEKGHHHGTIKVLVHDHDKNAKNAARKGKGTEGHVVTVHVNGKTRFEVIAKGKGEVKEKLAHFHNVHPGAHVRVKFDHDNHAHEVDILHHLGDGKGKGKGKK